jgi:N6-L-threonylcarbamoyladenine synthase
MNYKTSILAIESSCDETSASVVQNGKILSNIISTQPIHSQYGGVIPELASRAHEKNIIPVVNESLIIAGVEKSELSAVAFTQGPGLLGSLLVGCCFAKSFAQSLKIPLIGVHHIEAHIWAHFIGDNPPPFPFLCLVVSGGHTQIVLVLDFGKYQILGSTLDDAVGEAFDKVAKILGLPYPGGPHLDKNAQKGNHKAFEFAIPEIKNYDYSFSGFKTSVLYFLNQKLSQNPLFIQENLADICASAQYTLIEILMRKLIKAAKDYNIKHIAIAGGVAANSELRRRLLVEKQKYDWQVYIPAFQYCTDNAAMVAIASYYKYKNNDFLTQSATPYARYSMV